MIRHGKTHAESGSMGGEIGGPARARKMTPKQHRAHCAKMRRAKALKAKQRRAEERRMFRKLGISLTRGAKVIRQVNYGLTPSPPTRGSVEQFLILKAARDAKMVRFGVARR